MEGRERVWERGLRRWVVRERLPSGGDPALEERFVREARVPARLEHPAVPPLHGLASPHNS